MGKSKRGEILDAIRQSVGLPLHRHGDGFDYNPGYISTQEAIAILAWITTAQAKLIERPNDGKTPTRVHGSRTSDREGKRRG